MTQEKETTTGTDINPLNIVLGLVEGVVRGGLAVVSVPLSLLPADTNQQVRKTVYNVTNSVMEVPRELSRMTQDFVDQVSSGSSEISLPRVEEITERAREFTDRITKSVQDVGNSVTNSDSGSTASQGKTKPAAQADEWVEKKK